MPPTGLHPPDQSLPCQMVIEIPDSYDNPNSVAIQQSTVLEKQSKQPRLMLFIIITALFIATFSVKIFFKTGALLDQQLWKWFAFVFVICCCQIVNERIVTALLFLTETYFVMKRSDQILYFCYGLKTSVLYFFWLGPILLAWGLLIGLDAKWKYLVTSTLATCVIGTGIWILKTMILNVLACGLVCDKKFLDKIQDLISQQYVLQTLLGVPAKGNTVQLKWIIEVCVNIFGSRRFFILCDALNKTLDDDDDDDGDETLINQEVETVVSQILKNLKKNELREIHEVDLLQVMKGEDVPNVLKLFEGAVETKVINDASLKNWMMIVEKMGIWQTVFLKENNEKLYCTTASLLTKNIINYNRSFKMRDILEILVDDSTSNENIVALELKINEYIEGNLEIWCPKHSFQIQEIEDAKEKYSLHITYAMNFQNYEEKINRRSELVLELKKSLAQLGIKYFSIRFLT